MPDAGEIVVNHHTVDDVTRFSVEVVISGDAVAAEPIEPDKMT